MKSISPLFILLLLWLGSPAQQTVVKGKIINEKEDPIELASVALLNGADSTLLLSGLTDSLGSFEFRNIGAGSFLVAASAAGTNRAYYSFQLMDSSLKELIVPSIRLKEGAELKEFEVRALQPIFIHKPDMLVMNVEGSAIKTSGTALDLLKKVPGVIVDNNNNIIFRGKPGVMITIDGKPTYLANEQLISFLDNMSASEIIRIEIITNPSARYDAAGRGGYINIVTKKKIREGLNGSALTWGAYGLKPKFGGGGELSYGSKKWNFYGSHYSGYRDNLEEMYIRRKVNYADTLTTFTQESELNELNIFHNLRAGADYFSDSATSMGLVAGGRIFDGGHRNITNTLIDVSPGDTGYSLKQTNVHDKLDFRVLTGIYYKKQLDTSGGEFSFNADLVLFRNGSDRNFRTDLFDGSGLASGSAYLQRNQNRSNIDIYSAKLDFIHPFKGSQAKIETGIKSSYVKTDNSLQFEVYDNTSWINDTLRTNDFIYKELINAAYAMYHFKLGKFGFQAGLRAEHTLSDGTSPTLQKQVVDNYIELFPSVFIGRPLGKNHNLSASYSRRIDRPGYEDLNPFIFYLDQFTFEKGNPFLKPQFTNAFNLQYSFMDAVFLAADYSRTKDAMTDVTLQIDSTGVTYLAHENLSTVDNASLSLAFPIPIKKWFMAENSIAETYASYRSPLYGEELNRKAWGFIASSTLKFMMKNDWTLEISGSYNSKMKMGIFDIQEQYRTDIGLVKYFAQKTWMVSATLNDIFKTSSDRITINFQGQDVVWRSYDEERTFWLRVRYTFGKQQQQRRSGYKNSAEDLQQRANKK